MTGTELFNLNLASTIVSSGGNNAPAQGTQQTWTVTSSAMFPVAATGISQFHVSDPNAVTEMIAVINVSGTTWTVIRGAESTTPVVHSAGFTVNQVTTAGALTQLRAVDWLNVVTQYGADPTGVADSTTAIQAALNAVPASGGVVYLPAGTYKVTSTLTNAVTPTFITGDGRYATLISYTGSGDCIRMYNPAYPSSGFISLTGNWGGGVAALTIDGNSASAGACGLHTGDGEEAVLDLAIQHFNGAGSIGLHLDNTIWWTEKMRAHVALVDNTANVVLDVTAGPATTVAAGSNGGEISTIATWGGTYGGNGVLDVGSIPANWPTAGRVNVAASGATTALVTYTGVSGDTLTGCAYVSGSATGTVSTGGAVTLATSTESYGYCDLAFDIFANANQDGVVIQNGAYPYHGRLTIRGNFGGTNSAPQTSAVLTVTGTVPAGHPNPGAGSAIYACRLDIQAEAGSGTYQAQTIHLGSTSANTIHACTGIMDFTQGATAFTAANFTTSTAAGAFSFQGIVAGDFNLNPAQSGGSVAMPVTLGTQVYAQTFLSGANGNAFIEWGDFLAATLSASITVDLTPGSNPVVAGPQRKTFIITQAASGGPYTVTWPQPGSPTITNPAVYWPGGVAPVMSTAAGAVDAYNLSTVDGIHWYGLAIQAGTGVPGVDWKNVTWFGADPTGVADSTSAIQAAISALPSAGGVVYLPAGTYLVNSSSALSMATAGGVLRGDGYGNTTIKIGSSFSAAQVISVAAASCEVRDLGIVGASSTVTSNPAANGIELNGYAHCRFENIWGQYVNGWLIESVGGSSAANLDTMIGRIVSRNCAGGVHVKGVSGSSYQGEHFLTDIQVQQSGAASGANANLDALLIEDASDVLVQGLNVGIASGTTGSALHIKGACATVAVTNPDVGANATSGSGAALHIESSSNGSPSGVTINGGSVEGGSAAIQVDAGSDVTLNGVRGHQAYGDGLQVNGTPEVLAIGCSLAANNQNGGTAYDINCSGMSGGNFRAVSCRTETAIGTSTPGEVPNSVSASTHAYFKSCWFIATGSSPSNVFTGTPQQVTECVGYNPRGTVTAPSVGTSPYTPGTYQAPLMVIFTAVNGMMAFEIGSTSTGYPVLTVAAGSNGGEISTIASWGGTYGGNGVLAVSSVTGYPAAGGTLWVAASGSTIAVITYTGVSGSTFTGCAYVSGSPTGTVATGNTVSAPNSVPAAGVPFPVGVRESMTVIWVGTAPTWNWFGL